MSDVFLSYAREDLPKAKAIADALSAHGWTVWWDRKISPGLSYEEVIERELTSAKAVIVLWSAASAASSWVRNEAADAGERGKLVPVLIERVKIPIGFRHMQTPDLSAWIDALAGPSPEWEAVLERIAELHGRPARAAAAGAHAPAAGPDPVPPRPRTSPGAQAQPFMGAAGRAAAPGGTGWRVAPLALAGGAALVLAIVAGVLISQSRSSDVPPSDASEPLETTGGAGTPDSASAATLETTLDITATSGSYGVQALTPGFSPDPVTVSLIAGGGTDLSTMSSGAGCIGWAATRPDFVVDLTEAGERLRFYATSAGDTALAVLDPNGAWHCDDDTGGNRNPDVTVEPSPAGTYRVWLTTYSQGSSADATLHVSELTGTPVAAAPAN